MLLKKKKLLPNSSVSSSLPSTFKVEAMHLEQCNLSNALRNVPKPHTVGAVCHVALGTICCLGAIPFGS